MLTIHSPKFSTGKTEITKNSPTFRSKRAPSAQDTYTLESKSKVGDSPTKLSEGRKKKSYLDLHPSPLIAKPTKEKGTRQIIDSIQNLKQQYKSLKDAYQELIYERTRNNQEINKIRSQNMQLQIDNQRILRQNDKFKMQLSFQQQEIDRTKRQYANLLQVEKFKVQKLEESLHEKEEYINQNFLKIRTEANQSAIFHKHNSHVNKQDQISFTISQDKSAVLQDHSLNNQSQFLSFSLTSVLEQSTDKEPSMNSRKNEHARVASDLPPRMAEDDKKPHTFRKQKKEAPMPKLELVNIESKANLISTIPHRSFDKKSKAKTSKTFRDKQNRQTLNNGKKKSKKLINMSNIDN